MRTERATSSPEKFIRRTFTQLKSVRRRQGFSFTLSYEDLLSLYQEQKGRCALSGVKMTNNLVEGNTSWSDNQANISIDRKSNDKGYEIDNIQLVCKRVNLAKHTLNNKEFIKWCVKVTENQYRVS
jgi:hypothetical protein